MARIVIEVDEQALAEASQLLGTITTEDTVNAALRAVSARGRRSASMARMRKMIAEGTADPSPDGDSE